MPNYLTPLKFSLKSNIFANCKWVALSCKISNFLWFFEKITVKLHVFENFIKAYSIVISEIREMSINHEPFEGILVWFSVDFYWNFAWISRNPNQFCIVLESCRDFRLRRMPVRCMLRGNQSIWVYFTKKNKNVRQIPGAVTLDARLVGVPFEERLKIESILHFIRKLVLDAWLS